MNTEQSGDITTDDKKNIVVEIAAYNDFLRTIAVVCIEKSTDKDFNIEVDYR